MGDEARDEVELGNRECPRRENVGVVGEGPSVDDVDDVERCRPCPVSADSGESIVVSSFSFFRASTSCGSLNGLSSRMLYEKGRLDLCDNQQNSVMPAGVGQT